VATPSADAPQVQTVLVVEDEDSIRMLIQYSLENRGFRVLVARDGLEAMQLAKEHEGIIDILVTDLVMPGLSGTELVEKLHALRPYMKIVLISGNTDPSPLLGEHPDISMLAKPFSPSQLVDMVQNISK
jgi:two-component system cell cycle sensor histidine kinase/response regulator CckA